MKREEELMTKLAFIADRYREVEKSVGDPEVVSNPRRYRDLMREYKKLEPLVEIYTQLTAWETDWDQCQDWLVGGDAEFVALAKEEIPSIQDKLEQGYAESRLLLLPRDEADDRPVMMELRAGTGGDEAALFAGDLFRMYQRYAESKGWKVQVVNVNEGTAGGFKEIIARVEGVGVYGLLKFESGVHRVQRVPETESQGRVHTSAATVAIMPVAEEVDVSLDLSDVRRDTYRASGAGGQHVNKTESAVRLTHLPTGVVVECQDGRSQHQNYEHALEVLRSRLFEREREKQHAEQAQTRKTLVSSGDRSAKIRTYNFPQGRVTDHRIHFTSHALPSILGGDLQGVIDALHQAEQAELLAAQTSENS
ncbi:MAG: peptide chain release factor 1 [Bacteroidetes bacterium]|jgi:peptide chain release factor 1|nr:peptide chain release factor 1 [Bacteroidota bacterium]